MSGQMECMGCQSERCFSRKSRKPSSNCSKWIPQKVIRVTHRRSQETNNFDVNPVDMQYFRIEIANSFNFATMQLADFYFNY